MAILPADDVQYIEVVANKIRELERSKDK